MLTVDLQEEAHLDGFFLLVEMTLVLALVLLRDLAQSEHPGIEGLQVDRNTGGADKHLNITQISPDILITSKDPPLFRR